MANVHKEQLAQDNVSAPVGRREPAEEISNDCAASSAGDVSQDADLPQNDGLPEVPPCRCNSGSSSTTTTTTTTECSPCSCQSSPGKTAAAGGDDDDGDEPLPPPPPASTPVPGEERVTVDSQGAFTTLRDILNYGSDIVEIYLYGGQ